MGVMRPLTGRQSSSLQRVLHLVTMYLLHHAAMQCRLSADNFHAMVYQYHAQLHSELSHWEAAIHYGKLNYMVSWMHADQHGPSLLNLAHDYKCLWIESGRLCLPIKCLHLCNHINGNVTVKPETNQTTASVQLVHISCAVAFNCSCFAERASRGTQHEAYKIAVAWHKYAIHRIFGMENRLERLSRDLWSAIASLCRMLQQAPACFHSGLAAVDCNCLAICASAVSLIHANAGSAALQSWSQCKLKVWHTWPSSI